MNLKFGNKIIELNEWALCRPDHPNRIRKINTTGTINEGPLLMVSWANEDNYNNRYHWHIEFLGSQLFFINKIYNTYSHPKFMDNEYEIAQNYIDNFMIKISKLLIFT